MQKKTTLSDIAREACVSKATVSMALHNNPKIANSTRDLVRDIARRLNYNPDPIMSQMASHRWLGGSISLTNSAYISFINPTADDQPSPGRNFRRQFTGAKKCAEALGHNLEHLHIDTSTSLSSINRILESRGITGLIVSQTFDDAFYKVIDVDRYCIVSIDLGYYDSPFHQVRHEMAYTIERAWNLAIEYGHRRIGVVLIDEPGAIDFKDKLSTVLFYQDQLEESDRVPILRLNVDKAGEAKSWFETYRPSVVIGYNSSDHYAVFRRNGWCAPKDASFISLYSTIEEEYTPRQNAFVMDNERLGEIGARVLDKLIRNNERGIPELNDITYVKPVYREGKTLLPVG